MKSRPTIERHFEFRCKAILRALHRAGGQASERQLAQAVGVATTQRKRFGDYLRALVLRKILRSKAGLFRTIDPVAAPTPLAPQPPRRVGGSLMEGSVVFDAQGRAHLLSVEPPLVLPFDATPRPTLLDGDRVRAVCLGDRLQDVELVRRDGRWLGGVTRAAGRRVYVQLDGAKPAVRMHLERVSVQPAPGDIVRLRASRWPDRRNRLAAWWGVVEEILGPEGSAAAERERLVFHYGFGRPFDGPTLQAARQVPRQVRASDVDGRVDLRSMPMLAIATEQRPWSDHVWTARVLDDGRLRLMLSVVDVAHYVAPGTPLDRAAAARGFSVRGARPHAMLPPRLTQDVLHMVPEVDRLAVTVELDVASDGTVMHSRIFESAVRVGTMLSEAQAAEAMQHADPLHEQSPANVMRFLAEASRRAGVSGAPAAVLAHGRALADVAVGRWLREHLVPALYVGGPGRYGVESGARPRVEFCEPLASYAAIVTHQCYKAACSGALPPRSAAALTLEASHLYVAYWRAQQVAGT